MKRKPAKEEEQKVANKEIRTAFVVRARHFF